MECQEQINAFYNNKLKSGDLLYNSKTSQQVRFGAFLPNVSFRGKRLLDVGCGTGDFYDFLCAKDQAPAFYHGIDILPEVIRRGQASHATPDVRLEVCEDYLAQPFSGYDIVTGVDVFAFRFFAEAEQNQQHVLGRFFKKMYDEAEEAAGATFFSAEKYDTDVTEAVFSAHKVVETLLPLMPRIVLNHSFAPHVFTITAYKGPTPWHREMSG